MDNLEKTFGLLIAFLLPGFICIVGISFTFQEVSSWLYESASKDAPTVGGFLFSTLASLSLGV